MGMRATFKVACWALAALALGGCSGTGVQAVTAAPTASVSTAPDRAAAAVARNAPQLLEVAKRFGDQGCAYGKQGSSCSTDRVALGRLAGALQKDLDAAAPWGADVADLAERTASRLAAVAVLAEDETRPGAMLDTELVLLSRDLQEWSAHSG